MISYQIRYQSSRESIYRFFYTCEIFVFVHVYYNIRMHYN